MELEDTKGQAFPNSYTFSIIISGSLSCIYLWSSK